MKREHYVFWITRWNWSLALEVCVKSTGLLIYRTFSLAGLMLVEVLQTREGTYNQKGFTGALAQNILYCPVGKLVQMYFLGIF